MAKPILYGVSDFVQIMTKDGYYLDRTGLLPELEKTQFVLFLRPRRFGKSLLLSMLQCYYDVHYAHRFQELFGKLAIYNQPTAEQGHYLVLTFNFSAVEKQLDRVQESFDSYVAERLDAFACCYKNYLSPNLLAAIAKAKNGVEKLRSLATWADSSTSHIYVMIDEYDNFTNTILSEHGLEAYNTICHGEGFFKQFFNTLKLATTASDSPIKRLFITGVSPVTMDDVTSGFNIAKNISVQKEFAQLLGFAHQELHDILDYYEAEGQFLLDKEKAFNTMLEWYDNYCFSRHNNIKVANTTLVLNYVKDCLTGTYPDKLWDENLRTDYSKIQYLVTLNHQLNGSFHALEELAAEKTITNELAESFTATAMHQPENFISLLYYFGLLTIGSSTMGLTNFIVPNRTVELFLNSFIPSGYQDVHQVDTRLSAIMLGLVKFAQTGTFQPVLDNLAAVIKDCWAVRDTIEGERVIQAMLVALLTVASRPFDIIHEHEAAGGYMDLGLAPRLYLYPEISHALLLELKYVKAGEKIPEKLVGKAAQQLEKYATDNNIKSRWQIGQSVTLHKWLIVFHGGELAMAHEF